MTEKQKKFCLEYIKTLNGTTAYKNAYSATKDTVAAANANRLLKREDIKSYIAKQIDKQKSKQTADIEEILQFLTSVLRGEVPEEITHYDKDYARFKFAEKRPAIKDRLRACELLGKRLGLDKIEEDNEDIRKLEEVLKNIKGVI